MVMLTDNQILIDNLRDLPALMCVQRRAEKKIPTEEDLIRSNLDNFGNEIGETTNRITAMFDVQSRFPKDSIEYKTLDYRIKCGQLYQQNAIDKAKGIIAKSLPREWYDIHHVLRIPNKDCRELSISVLSDKKPYFMRYIYGNLMAQYNTYIKNANKKSQREFSLSINELMSKSVSDLSEKELEFIKYYLMNMPSSNGNCVVNRICRKFENEFDGYLSIKNTKAKFDYSIMKSGIHYEKSQYNSILKLFEDYNKRMQQYTIFAKKERVSDDELFIRTSGIRNEFRSSCDLVCSNSKVLCEILLDICYKRGQTKKFVWDMCAEDIIGNLLDKSGNIINYPKKCSDGDVKFKGLSFSFDQVKIGV